MRGAMTLDSFSEEKVSPVGSSVRVSNLRSIKAVNSFDLDVPRSRGKSQNLSRSSHAQPHTTLAVRAASRDEPNIMNLKLASY